MPTPAGIFVLGELTGVGADEIQAVVNAHDPRLARRSPRPHLTLAGSSGIGPAAATTSAAELGELLGPVAAGTNPIVLELGAPERFPATDIVVLPVAARGKIRELHDRLATSGIHWARPRFAFSPHVTLNLYRELTRERLRELLDFRVAGAVTLGAIECVYTQEPNEARVMLRLPLGS